MYQLYYAPDNASLIVRLVLEELHLPYDTILVDRRAREQDSDTYRALNPQGLIPTLVTADGAVFETGAILLWLSETHSALAPQPGDADRAGFLKWLFFLSNSFHADLRQLFYPHYFVVTPAEIDGHHAMTKARLQRQLATLDDLAGAGHGWFNAADPSVFDYYVACCLRWLALYPAERRGWFDLAATPALESLAKRLETRDAVQRSIAAEGLGPSPFSAPDYARPPVGSAT